MSDAATTTLTTIRRLLLALLAFGLIGTVSELWLIGHHEDWWQMVPLVMIGTSAVVLAWVAWSWTAGAVRVFRVCMLFLMLSGATGSILHYRANMEFQLEMDPTLGGVALMSKVLHAKAPPTLAPGNMVLLGLLGLVSTVGVSRTLRSGGS